MPKGANKELAQSFVNFLCNPEIAVRNMNYIGYTSSIAGDEILDMIDDWYGAILPEYNEEEQTWYYDEVDLGIQDSTLEVSVKDREHRHPPIVRSACPRSFCKIVLLRWWCCTHKRWQAVQTNNARPMASHVRSSCKLHFSFQGKISLFG